MTRQRFRTEFLGAHTSSSDDPEAGLCVGRPYEWDLEVLGTDDRAARQALATCFACPRLQTCRRDVERRDEPPQSVIEGGQAFTATGKPIAPKNLRQSMLIAESRRQQTAEEWASRGGPGAVA